MFGGGASFMNELNSALQKRSSYIDEAEIDQGESDAPNKGDDATETISDKIDSDKIDSDYSNPSSSLPIFPGALERTPQEVERKHDSEKLPELDIETEVGMVVLDHQAAKHKLSVKPKRKYERHSTRRRFQEHGNNISEPSVSESNSQNMQEKDTITSPVMPTSIPLSHSSQNLLGLDRLVHHDTSTTTTTTTTTMAASMNHYKDQAVKLLYEKNQFTDILAQIEAKTRISREHIASGAFVLVGLYLVVGYGPQLICNAIGFVYPTYCSLKALETDSTDDDTRWLTYWVVFAIFSVSEYFSDILLSWFPLYWLAKYMFLVWCFLPLPWNGSDVIYNRIIRPNFLKNQTQIDKAMEKVTDELGDLAGNITHIASDVLIQHAFSKSE